MTPSDQPHILMIALQPSIAGPFQKALMDAEMKVRVQSMERKPNQKPKTVGFDLVITLWKTQLRHADGNETGVDAMFMSRCSKNQNNVSIHQNGTYGFGESEQEIKKFVKTVKELTGCEENVQHSPLSENPGKPYLDRIIGRTKVMVDLKKRIENISARPMMPVLITGETGTGKELVADALHHMSPRRDKPFVKINCSAIPEALLESQLFGHVKGAFTGAVQNQKGFFEQADGGTILLDEIGDMSPVLQPKLLRLLETNAFYPVGSVKEKQVDVWVLASTNVELSNLINNNVFRSDLYYRLSGCCVHIPPLRQRGKDIVYIVNKIAKENNVSRGLISSEIIQQLTMYKWPGNVRELIGVLRSLFINSSTRVFRNNDLPEYVLSYMENYKSEKLLSLKEIERKYIKKVYEITGKQICTTADILRIHKKTLKSKLNHYQIL